MVYNNLDQAYRQAVPSLVSYAQKHIYNKSYAIDAVHNAFIKAQMYLVKHPEAKVSGFLLKREVIRACRRMNKKYSIEISVDSQYAFKNQAQDW